MSREHGRGSTQPTTFPLERCVLGSQRQTFWEWNSEAAIYSQKETLTSRGAQSDGLNTHPAVCSDGASQRDEPLLHRPSRTFSHDACPPPGLCRVRGQPSGLDSQLLEEEMGSKTDRTGKVLLIFKNQGSLRYKKQIRRLSAATG